MSRVGNKLIALANGTTVEVKENNVVLVKGPKGELEQQFSSDITISVEDGTVKLTRPSDSIKHKTIHGTTRALLNNMVEGVTNGFTKILIMEGVGYRASLKGNVLVVAAGYSHTIEKEIPNGVTVSLPSQTEIHISGTEKQVVGQFAAEIRAIRKPEPYLGKGIRYKGEIIRRKEGKKAK